MPHSEPDMGGSTHLLVRAYHVYLILASPVFSLLELPTDILPKLQRQNTGRGVGSMHVKSRAATE